MISAGDNDHKNWLVGKIVSLAS